MAYDRTVTQSELQKEATSHIRELTRRLNEGQWALVQNWQNFLSANGWTLPANITEVTAAITGATPQFVTDYNAAMIELNTLKTTYDNNATALWLFV